MTSIPIRPPPAQAPDWSRIDRDIACPLCGYNLRGLVEPRCPECGYVFEWGPLLNPPPSHPYLFEHRRGMRAFACTLVATLAPNRFWALLQPTHEPRPARLAAYWVQATALMLIPAACLTVFYVWALTGFVAPPYWPELITGMNWVDAMDRAIRHSHLLAAAVIAVWPVGTGLLLLSLFQSSLGRARIRAVHVWRCAVYTGDAALWLAVAAAVLNDAIPRPAGYLVTRKWVTAICVAVVLACFTGARLGIACDRYLRLDHPRAVAAATQVILLLITLILAVYVWN
jgi:rubredoxin